MISNSKHGEGAFSLSFKYRFEAAHRFTQSCADSCATPHGHTWYAKAVFSAPSQALAESAGHGDMVMEFSTLKRAWKAFIQETADHSFFHHHEDPILPALRETIRSFRGLPFPGDPTTELISMLFFAKLKTMHEQLPGHERLKPTAMVIRETPTNQVTYRGGAVGLLETLSRKYEAWWQSPDPSSRLLRPRS